MPELPRRNRRSIDPQPSSRSSRRDLGAGVVQPVCGRLLSLVLLVVPGKPRRHHLQICVLSINEELRNQPPISVLLRADHGDGLAKHQGTQPLLGYLPKWLALLGRINAGKADFQLHALLQQYGHRISVGHTHHGPGHGLRICSACQQRE